MSNCHCCSGVTTATPLSTYNPPGASRLSRRVGTHGRFAETMRARLASRPALAALTARSTDDFSIALFDAWAVIGDVLTFYQERIADEGYLRTAAEAFSIYELGRLVGYAPRPALGASCYVAYSLDPGAESLIPMGSQVKNVSADGSPPQTFETTEDLMARDEWSNLTPRRTAPVQLSGARVTLVGAATSLKTADRILLLGGPDNAVPRVVADAEPDYAENVTRVTLVDPKQPTPAETLEAVMSAAMQDAPATVSNALPILSTLRDDPAQDATTVADQIRQLHEQIALARAAGSADVRQWLDRSADIVLSAAATYEGSLQHAERILAPAIDEAQRAAARQLCPDSGDELLGHDDGDCDRGAAMAALTPILPALRKPPSQPPVSSRALPTSAAQDFAPDSDVGAKLLAASNPRLAQALYPAWRNAEIAPPARLSDVLVMRTRARGHVEATPEVALASGSPTALQLDAVYDSLLPGTWVIVDGGAASTASQIASVAQATAPVTDNVSVPVTVLTLTRNLPAVQEYVVWGAGESVQPLGEPITEAVAGADIELDRAYDGLTTGRWLVVSGERTDVPYTSGVPGVELTMISAVRQRVDLAPGGGTLRTVLELATPLAYAYRRDTVTIYGNVVAATQGETRSDVLGSGDASTPAQSFPMRQVDAQHPLTALPADNPQGFERAAVVRVNGVSWRDTDVLGLAGPTEHVYAVHTSAESASVGFGDGVNGARLPTGLANVTARYRVGAGSTGNVAAGQISQLATRPLGVSGVTNPIPSSGGARGDGPGDARAVTPLRTLALDRLVSDVDYENFTRARAGIGKASARRLTDGSRQVVHVTIAGVDDAPIEPTATLLTTLQQSLADFGDPPLPVVVQVRDLMRIVLSAGVHVAEEYSWDLVEPAVRSAVLDALGFTRQELGQPAFLSAAIAAMQAVPGVDYVDVDVFAGVSADATPLELITLGSSLGGAQPCVPARRAGWRTTSYVVQPGDTLTSVARAHGLSLDELIALNPRVGRDVGNRTLTVARGFVPAQLAVLTADVPETLRLRRIT